MRTVAIAVIAGGALALLAPGFSTASESSPPAKGLETVVVTTAESRFQARVFNQGWWADGERNSNGNDNYIVGRCCGATVHRNFFTFDLSDVKGHIVFAQLRVHSGTVLGQASETVSLFDVTTAAAVVNRNTAPSAAVYRDLGTGVSYGSFPVLATQDREQLHLTLNRAAVRDMNRSTGFFTIGGVLTTLSSEPGAQYIFGRTGSRPAELVLRTTHGPRG